MLHEAYPSCQSGRLDLAGKLSLGEERSGQAYRDPDIV